MFRVLNAILFSCALATSIIAADNAASAKKPSSLLSDYRLTWDINSAAWGWNIDSTVDIEEVRKFTSSISSAESNEAGYAGRVKISGEAGGEAKAGLSIIGVPHLSINGYARMGFDKEKSSFLSNTSRTELKNIAEAINLYSKRVHLSKMHLSFTVTFSNLTDEDVELRCTSVPVRCGGEHYVDATPVQGKEAIIIPGGLPEGIDVMFRAELDTTKAASLINAMQENNLEINLLRGQLKVVAKDGANLISETSKKSAQTNRLDICTSGSDKNILSWRISKGNELRANTPLKTILEEINQKYITDEDGVPLFKLDGNNISGVGILPIVGDETTLLAISGEKTELLSDLDLSKPMQGDLTIFCLLTNNTSDNTYKKYLTSNVIAGLLKFAEKNNPRAQRRLGFCYYQGYGVAQDKKKAVEWWRKAADQGDAKSQNNLGECYYESDGVPENYNEAVKWYRKAADQGDADAQYNLGRCYALGQGVGKDEAEAVKWYRKAAEQGHADAQYNLGRRYAHGEGVAKDEAEAVKWYRKAAEQGNAEAQWNLGYCYFYSKGVAKDAAEAVKWYRKAADQGDACAQYILGYCYFYGEGVAKDSAEAVKWYRKAADQGDTDAQWNLGQCYARGKGIDKDEAEAVKWYRKAAEQGSADAQSDLGYCYFYGKGVAKDAAEAVKWCRKAAEQGSADAQSDLGLCYSHGEGVAKDEAEAVKWYRKAAEQSDAMGQYNLGCCYALGQGVAKDEAEAVKWYRKAAEQGHADAQYNLGRCYARGEGVAKDKAEAIKWYSKAADQGDTEAQKLLKSLEK